MTPIRPSRLSAVRRRGIGFGAVLAFGTGAALCLSPAAAVAAPDAPARCDDETARPTLNVASASPAEELTSAFRVFGDTGGGWEDDGGWAASDGTYSVELADGGIAWLMNDTFMGPLEDGRITNDARFLHGTVLMTDTDGNPVDTITGGTHESPTSIVDPPEAVQGNPWYWNEDGLVDDGALQVFQAKTAVNDDDPPFNFAWIGSDIVTYDASFNVTAVTPTFGHVGGVHWGVEVVPCGEDTYIYGQRNGAGYVARVPQDALLDQQAWRFYADGEWVANEDSSTPIITNIGATFSVSLIDGTFVFASTETFGPFGSHTIDAAVSGAAQGPFVDRQPVYTAPEGREGILAPYNVAAHPWLSEDGTLLVSYNVNAMNHDDVLADPNNYRPRFISLALTPTDGDGSVDPIPAPDPTSSPSPQPSPGSGGSAGPGSGNPSSTITDPATQGRDGSVDGNLAATGGDAGPLQIGVAFAAAASIVGAALMLRRRRLRG